LPATFGVAVHSQIQGFSIFPHASSSLVSTPSAKPQILHECPRAVLAQIELPSRRPSFEGPSVVWAGVWEDATA
jgi:hypothetical protein